MFVTILKIATIIMLPALTCSVGPTGYAKAPDNDAANKDATKTLEPRMFPDGVEYNFGKVTRLMLPFESFHYVNLEALTLVGRPRMCSSRMNENNCWSVSMLEGSEGPRPLPFFSTWITAKSSRPDS